MQRVYLDQNAWIALAKAKLGRPDAPRGSRDVFDFVREAARRGDVSFVLSLTHLYETQKRGWDSRLDIVETMAELSKFETIVHPKVIVPQEVDHLVAMMLNEQEPRVNVFGRGLFDLLGPQALEKLAIPAEVDATHLTESARLAELLNAHRGVADQLLLLAGPQGYVEGDLAAFAEHLREIDRRFSDGQTDVAAKIAGLGIDNTQLDDVLVSYVLLEIKDEIMASALRYGVSPDSVMDWCITHPRRALELLPSRHVVQKMMFRQHVQRQTKWKENDLHDFTALGVAVPYCDVVVTENHWVDTLRRTGTDTTYATSLVSMKEIGSLHTVLLGLLH
ncbi:hypothetical protein [Williamsia soli]|uniref:hypothetical protein n=1 Tax=Williamsia soli TaxID=364929 RepID=UPI001A9E0015|nr:hypothetical protein [Williamsia soli]